MYAARISLLEMRHFVSSPFSLPINFSTLTHTHARTCAENKKPGRNGLHYPRLLDLTGVSVDFSGTMGTNMSMSSQIEVERKVVSCDSQSPELNQGGEMAILGMDEKFHLFRPPQPPNSRLESAFHINKFNTVF